MSASAWAQMALSVDQFKETISMSRQRPMRASPPLQESAPATTSASNDPAYQALLAAESAAYTAWLSYTPAQSEKGKEELTALRRAYEQKRNERRAYRPPSPAELNTAPSVLPWK